MCDLLIVVLPSDQVRVPVCNRLRCPAPTGWIATLLSCGDLDCDVVVENEAEKGQQRRTTGLPTATTSQTPVTLSWWAPDPPAWLHSRP